MSDIGSRRGVNTRIDSNQVPGFCSVSVAAKEKSGARRVRADCDLRTSTGGRARVMLCTLARATSARTAAVARRFSSSFAAGGGSWRSAPRSCSFVGVMRRSERRNHAIFPAAERRFQRHRWQDTTGGDDDVGVVSFWLGAQPEAMPCAQFTACQAIRYLRTFSKFLKCSRLECFKKCFTHVS